MDIIRTEGLFPLGNACDIILSFTQNGGANTGPPHFPGFKNNYLLRGIKGNQYQGGVRVPALYLDPRLPESTKGTERDFLIHITDWLPTLKSSAWSDEQICK